MTLTTPRVSALTATGLFVGAALLPAGSAFATASCPTGSTLVDTNICEVTFTADGTWTPPAGVTKVQALLVGAGGSAGTSIANEYGGGGGDVFLVDLATSGEVNVTIGIGGSLMGPTTSTPTIVEQGTTTYTAEGGTNAGNDGDNGGDSGNGYQGRAYGAGAGAGGDGVVGAAGAGLVVNEIAGDWPLFANDDDCYGGGGVDIYSYNWTNSDLDNVISVEIQEPSCDGANGGKATYPVTATSNGSGYMEFVGSDDMLGFEETAANTGNGGGMIRGRHFTTESGSDGKVVIRFTAPTLASTGFDATLPALAGTALFAAGVVSVARRRRT